MDITTEPWISRYRISVEGFHRMGEAGVFERDARVELIEGEIVNMAPIGSPHVGSLNALNAWILRAVADRGVISIQNPLILNDHSEPQPDVVVLHPRADFYAGTLPRAADALLVVEVADSSVDYDRKVKSALYAAAGIPEYWIADWRVRKLVVHRDPAGEVYLDIRSYDTPVDVTLAADPTIVVALGQLFPA